jgi:hypothetical protein
MVSVTDGIGGGYFGQAPKLMYSAVELPPVSVGTMDELGMLKGFVE